MTSSGKEVVVLLKNFFHTLIRSCIQPAEIRPLKGFVRNVESLDSRLSGDKVNESRIDTAANIMVELYDDRLEITNSGGLLPVVARNFGHMSKSRNPKIFELFTRMDLVEKVGSGIPRIADLMKEAGLPAPEYRTEDFFTTVLYKKRPTSSQNVIEKVGGNVKGKAKRELVILDMMRLKPNISFAELAQALNVAERTIARDIAHLRETKKIDRQGGDKGGDKGGEWVIL